MLFLPRAFVLLVLSGSPVFGTPVGPTKGSEPSGEAVVSKTPQAIKFELHDPKLVNVLTLYRVPNSATWDINGETVDPNAQDVMQIDRKNGLAGLATLPTGPISVRWRMKPVDLQNDRQVAHLGGWWLPFPTRRSMIDKDISYLTHVRFDQNHVMTMKSIPFNPRIRGKLVEVSRLSEVEGLWYSPFTAFNGDPLLKSYSFHVIKIENDGTISKFYYKQGEDDGIGIVHSNPKAAKIDDLGQFRGCWIRYPISSLDLRKRMEVLCVKKVNRQFKAFRGTWAANTENPT